MKQRHNDYLDDYFESLDRDMNINRRIEPIRKETKNDGDVHNFQECVAFLNLIKKEQWNSKEWTITGTNFQHVLKFQEFGALAEILGLSRSDGEEIQRCYIDYLEVLVSFYKTARSSRDPMRGNEDLECFKDYRRDG
ncbi:hypothetical protein Tco_0679476 [Tanacetum coccineum]|uniref:ARID domain-containing protein n=1 Tax=Tanacetum coccineum TaxID=301880 RepID=A0ABQ4XIM6_9ASTR